MTWSIEGLEEELRSALHNKKLAWTNYIITRAEHPLYQAFLIIKKSYKEKVANNKFPNQAFVLTFEKVRKSFIDVAYTIPEWEEYVKWRNEVKELTQVVLDAKIKYGGGEKGE